MSILSQNMWILQKKNRLLLEGIFFYLWLKFCSSREALILWSTSIAFQDWLMCNSYTALTRKSMLVLQPDRTHPDEEFWPIICSILSINKKNACNKIFHLFWTPCSQADKTLISSKTLFFDKVFILLCWNIACIET